MWKDSPIRTGLEEDIASKGITHAKFFGDVAILLRPAAPSASTVTLNGESFEVLGFWQRECSPFLAVDLQRAGVKVDVSDWGEDA